MFPIAALSVGSINNRPPSSNYHSTQPEFDFDKIGFEFFYRSLKLNIKFWRKCGAFHLRPQTLARCRKWLVWWFVIGESVFGQNCGSIWSFLRRNLSCQARSYGLGRFFFVFEVVFLYQKVAKFWLFHKCVVTVKKMIVWVKNINDPEQSPQMLLILKKSSHFITISFVENLNMREFFEKLLYGRPGWIFRGDDERRRRTFHTFYQL